jgi:hypothetical protein
MNSPHLTLSRSARTGFTHWASTKYLHIPTGHHTREALFVEVNHPYISRASQIGLNYPFSPIWFPIHYQLEGGVK